MYRNILKITILADCQSRKVFWTQDSKETNLVLFSTIWQHWSVMPVERVGYSLYVMPRIQP